VRESFLQRLLEEPEDPEVVVRWKPTVHAELAMIIAMVNGEIEHVVPYMSRTFLALCAVTISAPSIRLRSKRLLPEVLTGSLTMGGSGLIFLAGIRSD